MTAAVIVFARVPLPGKVKTRLIDTLGPAGAATLYQALLWHTLAQVEQCSEITPYLFADSVEGQTWFSARLAPRWQCMAQCEGPLGERMHAALSMTLAVHARAVLIGSDIVDVSAARLGAALMSLATCDAVIGPAADGGYWLIGLTAPCAALFTGVAWGSEVVLAQTVHRLNDAGLRWSELPLGHDVDTPRDLARHTPRLIELLPESLLGARELRAKLLNPAALGGTQP